eukprot:gene1575-12700_t
MSTKNEDKTTSQLKSIKNEHTLISIDHTLLSHSLTTMKDMSDRGIPQEQIKETFEHCIDAVKNCSITKHTYTEALQIYFNKISLIDEK